MSDDCARAMLQLREELSTRWPGRIFYSGAENMSVLSLAPELTVWCLQGVFTWNDGKGVVRYRLDDVRSAADHLLELAADPQRRSRPAQRSAADPVTAATGDRRSAGKLADDPERGRQLPAPEPVGAS